MLVRSKFFLQFDKKIEKLKLSWSKQYSKMLKIKSETLKIRKNGKIIKLETKSLKFFRKFREPRESRVFLRSRKFPEIPGNIFENVSFPGKLKIR